jgi:hypothetical protein
VTDQEQMRAVRGAEVGDEMAVVAGDAAARLPLPGLDEVGAPGERLGVTGRRLGERVRAQPCPAEGEQAGRRGGQPSCQVVDTKLAVKSPY